MAETITVTAESPVVDVSSTKKEVVLDHDLVQNLPSSRQYLTLARIAAGTSGGGSDVGGSAIADVGLSLTVHGSKAVDQRVMLNGVSIMTLQAGGNIGGQQPDVGSAAEIAVDTSSLSAGDVDGRRAHQLHPEGRRQHVRQFDVLHLREPVDAGDQLHRRAEGGRAARRRRKIDSTWDLNESIGGPIKTDKAWFWFSTRFNRANAYAGIFANQNAYNPNAWTYIADHQQPRG